MQTVRIQTAQNVFIEYLPASVGDRILATIIDSVITYAYIIMAILMIIQFKLESHWIAYAIAAIPILFYELIFEIIMDGQTIGKKALNIKVARLDGTQPTIGNYLLRWLIRPIDVTVCSGAIAIIAIIANGKGQRLGDMAAGTTVISIRRKVRMRDALLPEIQDDYVPTFPQVVSLSDRDIAIIREALQTYKKSRNRDSWLLETLTEKVKGLLGVESSLTNIAFLQTVLKDHAYLTSQVSS